ncbi:MAG TPA: sulfurtransferase-like selenium metabolism protein YedF [Bacteroidales bacterium]|nr:sulfurtransferase-like selenium metabolism protein YedF [Bacteroidales bacterium]
MKIVDTRGQACPAPIIAAKKALKESVAGELFEILTDNLTSYNNLMRFLKDNKAATKVEKHEKHWKLTVSKANSESNGGIAEIDAGDYCSTEIAHFEKGDFIVVISSDRMGEGDIDLGNLLIGNFIKALKDLDKLPDKIIFYNSGVKLATKDSSYSVHLQDLEKMGVDIILCATCVNHYKLENAIAVGNLGNMFSIAEAMACAEKVIKP